MKKKYLGKRLVGGRIETVVLWEIPLFFYEIKMKIKKAIKEFRSRMRPIPPNIQMYVEYISSIKGGKNDIFRTGPLK